MSSRSTLTREAHRLVEFGWPLVPVGSDKTPLLRGWPDRATLDITEISRWLARWPRAGLAVFCGGAGLVIVDVDTLEGHGVDGEQALAALERDLGPLPATVSAVTPSGGRHRYFRAPEGRFIKSRPLRPGVDVRGRRALAVVPPSHLAAGRPYRWLTSPFNSGPAELPPRWLAAIDPPPRPRPSISPITAGSMAANRYAETALRSELQAIQQASSGTRNARLNQAGFALGQLAGAGLLDPGEIAVALAQAGLAIGLDRREVEMTLASSLRAGLASPRELRTNG
jgi:hypothetical protein